jgi:hypothetical protein
MAILRISFSPQFDGHKKCTTTAAGVAFRPTTQVRHTVFVKYRLQGDSYRDGDETGS